MNPQAFLQPVPSADAQRRAAFARIGADGLWETDTADRFAFFSRSGEQPTSEHTGRIRLRSQIPPDLSTIHADPTQVHQVLLNLCVNARDAMPKGGTLLLAAEAVSMDETLARTITRGRPGELVRLGVCDTGAGNGPGDLDRIFALSFTTTTLDLGTGLGLSPAKGIVKAHDGFFQVDSNVGQGSTFSASLPVAGADEGGEPSRAPDSQAPGRGELILVVDDEAAILQLYRVVLRQLGFQVVTASDGAEGLEQVLKLQADISAIVTDVRMPNIDGIGFIRALRERRIDIPVAVVSGRMEDAQVAELDELGVTTRLNKPFTQRRLLAALRQLLGYDLGAASGEPAGR